MRYTRLLPLAMAAALAAGLTGCATNADPYGPNNYPVSDINNNPAGTAFVEPSHTTTYVAPGAVTTYVAPGTTTTYVAPNGTTTTYVAPAGTTAYVTPGATTVTPAQTYVVPAVEYGRVTNVAMVNPGTRASGANGVAGTVIGGVVGGALGNTIGAGAGRAAATVLGAVAGAAVGNNLATRSSYGNYAGPVYRVWVATDSGVMRTYDVSATNLRPGDRVRIDNGVIYMG
jgi:outer membrane lipoprotein SlyB